MINSKLIIKCSVFTVSILPTQISQNNFISEDRKTFTCFLQRQIRWSKNLCCKTQKFTAIFYGCSIYPRRISPRPNCIYSRSCNSILLFCDHILYTFLIPLLQNPYLILPYIALKKYTQHIQNQGERSYLCKNLGG
jgi:hypothetical protein